MTARVWTGDLVLFLESASLLWKEEKKKTVMFKRCTVKEGFMMDGHENGFETNVSTVMTFFCVCLLA